MKNFKHPLIIFCSLFCLNILLNKYFNVELVRVSCFFSVHRWDVNKSADSVGKNFIAYSMTLFTVTRGVRDRRHI